MTNGVNGGGYHDDAHGDNDRNCTGRNYGDHYSG